MKIIDKFASKIGHVVIDYIENELRNLNKAIIKIANDVKPIPGYIMIESPDGKQAVSPIVWLLPGERAQVQFYCYIDFPKGSVIKANNPFWINRIRIGNVCMINSDEEACITCKTTDDLLTMQRIEGQIFYPTPK